MRNPRPPKKWFNDMMKRMRHQYPKEIGESLKHYKAALSEIVGGIWWNQYSPSTRRELIAEYDNPKGGSTMRNKGNPMIEGVVSGAEAEKLSAERMREMQRIAREERRPVSAGIYGSLWCPLEKKYTGQHRYITVGGKERFRCMSCMRTFSRGKHGWLEQYNPRRAQRNITRKQGVSLGAVVVVVGISYLVYRSYKGTL